MSDYNQRLRNVREHDACGIGAVVHIDGKADNKVVDQALTIVEKLEHRAGKDASGEVGEQYNHYQSTYHNLIIMQ